MSGDFYNPDSWMDLLDHLWIGLVFVLVAAVPSWLAARNHRTIKDIKHQVVNGHDNPLRGDLDRVIEAVENLGHDVRCLRSDLMAEENHRRIQINDLRDDLDQRTGKRRRL